MWLHPIVGALAVILMLWMAIVGLRLQQRRAGRTERRLHRWLGPTAGALTAVAGIAGTVSVLLVRDDMDLAATTHFYLGWSIVGLAALTGLTAWLRRKGTVARAVHPWLGLLLAAACLVEAFLGLEFLQ